MSKPLDPKDLVKLAFGLYPHLFPGGEQTVDPEPLLERVKRIDLGVQPEIEFFAIVSWLGKCVGIHRIDQTPMPGKEKLDNWRVPDFIAFPLYRNRILPVLIEVKKSDDSKLVWSESYFTALKNFAELLNLPLLIAWKSQFMWLLTDHTHFQKKVTAYHLDWETALKENLLSLLFGNMFIDVNEKFSLALDCEILDPLPDPNFTILPENEYTLQIKDYGIYIGETRIEKNDIPAECLSVLLTIPVENEVIKLSENMVRVIHRPIPENGIQLIDLFLSSLYLQYKDAESIDWNEVLRKGPFDSSGKEFRMGLRKPEARKFIDFFVQQAPVTMPPYLSADES